MMPPRARGKKVDHVIQGSAYTWVALLATCSRSASTMSLLKYFQASSLALPSSSTYATHPSVKRTWTTPTNKWSGPTAYHSDSIWILWLAPTVYIFYDWWAPNTLVDVVALNTSLYFTRLHLSIHTSISHQLLLLWSIGWAVPVRHVSWPARRGQSNQLLLSRLFITSWN